MAEVTYFRFYGVDFRLQRDDGVPPIALPTAFEEARGPTCDVFIHLKAGKADYPVPDDTLMMQAGPFRAYGTSEVIWTHPVAGTFLRADGNSCEAALFPEFWERDDQRFEHILLPGILHVMARRGIIAFHGAGVVVNGKAVLVTGPSGTGKSTTALRAVEAGAEWMGDDRMFLRHSTAGIELCGMGDFPRLREDVASLFPGFNQERNLTGGKIAVSVDRIRPRPALLKKIVILDPEERHETSILPYLLSLCYRLGAERQAMTVMGEVLDSVTIQSVQRYEDALQAALG